MGHYEKRKKKKLSFSALLCMDTASQQKLTLLCVEIFNNNFFFPTFYSKISVNFTSHVKIFIDFFLFLFFTKLERWKLSLALKENICKGNFMKASYFRNFLQNFFQLLFDLKNKNYEKKK